MMIMTSQLSLPVHYGKMMLIGYRMWFSELCTILNVPIDPEADYVEDDDAREELETRVLIALKKTTLVVLELPNDLYYLGLHPDLCKQLSVHIMPTRAMTEVVSELSVRFLREFKRIGIFKRNDCQVVSYPEPLLIQYNK